MVLIDDKSSKIQASIRKTLIYKFDRLLSEGHVYCLTYFGVGDNGGSYRYTKHAFKLNFQFNTKVQELKDFPINILPYSFVHLSDIMFNEHDTDFLVDIIGILTGVGAEREYEKDRKKQKILTIELDADGVRIECAFFGSYVDEINSVVSSADMTNAVVLIQFAKVKIFKGKPNLQNVYGATKVSFNPDIEEATKIKEKFFEIYEHDSQVLSQLQDPEQLSVEEDFLKATIGKSIKQVTDLDEADPSTFRDVVQRLTSAVPSKPAVKVFCGEIGTRGSAIKLHERRPTARRLEIELRDTAKVNGCGHSPTPARNFSGENMVMVSPVSPLEYLEASVARGSPRTPRSPMEEEERAIAGKGFYLHPSPLSTPRGSEPPELLTLFPLGSPKNN
ncbi:hypothetical protein OROGR_004910 [Orobanche gracilis]